MRNRGECLRMKKRQEPGRKIGLSESRVVRPDRGREIPEIPSALTLPDAVAGQPVQQATYMWKRGGTDPPQMSRRFWAYSHRITGPKCPNAGSSCATRSGMRKATKLDRGRDR